MQAKFSHFVTGVIALAAIVCFSIAVAGQKNTATRGASASKPGPVPTITRIDTIALRKLLVPNGRPLLINFWATWCDPCREEFPELVKINADYKGKIDFITISLDDLEDINTAVPKFLMDMKADMPAYLLATQDEDAAMQSVSANWAGGLPFTILFDEKGVTAYFRQGKVRPDILRAELTKRTAVADAK
jgi:thiol-disulfide isomerase/thioredoxin